MEFLANFVCYTYPEYKHYYIKPSNDKPLSPPDTWIGHYNANNIPDISPVRRLMLMYNEYKPTPPCNCRDCR